MKFVKFCVNLKKSKHTMKRYRYGFRLMHKLPPSRAYCLKLRDFKPPGDYPSTNQHHGNMPALPGEFTLSGKQAATIEQLFHGNATTEL